MLVYSKSASLKETPLSGRREVAWNAARHRYRRDPAAYAREVLKVAWWPKQAEVADALLKHRRVFVKASHAVGKSFLAGGLVNWFFDCFDPGICITTAPNAPQVRDILWKEIRVQRPADLRGALQPKAPRMETSPDHFAVGFTARDDSGFQGRHEEFVLIVFDECVGVAGPFWDAAEGMMTGEHCYFLAVCNPTDTSSRAYIECLNTEKWHVIEISALEHPNVAADLAGEPAPYPKAVRLEWVEGRIREWCTQMQAVGSRQQAAGDADRPQQAAGDVSIGQPEVGDAGIKQSPAGNGEGELLLPAACCLLPRISNSRRGAVSGTGRGRYLRAGCGGWPTQGATSVWTEAAWSAALVRQEVDLAQPPVIGCDVARFGDDFTSIVVRRDAACCTMRRTTAGPRSRRRAG